MADAPFSLDRGGPSVFERAYQGFMAAGGFAQPCLSEDYERQRRQLATHKPAACPHGRTRLTCGECWASDSRGYAI